MLRDQNLEVLCIPPYSPELTKIDCHIFQALGNILQVKMFKSQYALTAFRDFLPIPFPEIFVAGLN